MDPSKHKETSGRDAEAREADTNTDAVASKTSSQPQGDVSVSSSEGGSSSTSSSTSSSRVGVGGGSLGSTGMGNPFARAAPQATWATESSEQRPILAPPRLSPAPDSGGAKVSSSNSSTSTSSSSSVVGMLRPSALGPGRLGGTMRSPGNFFPPPALTVTASSPPQPTKSEFKLKPSVLSSGGNPFAKGEEGDTTNPDSGSQEPDQLSLTAVSEQQPSSATSTREDGGNAEGHSQPASTHGDSKAGNNIASSSSNLFLPLGNDSDSASSPTLAKNNFIFGQNLQSKISATGGSGGSSGGWGVSSSSADSSETTNGEKPTGNLFSEAASEVSRWSDGGAVAAAAATTNGQPHTGNLFSEAASGIPPPQEEPAWRVGQSLEESSREIQEKEKSQKRKFDEVEVITGEENESNVLQMNCKLYAWVSGWWQERGRGILRLNDWDAGQEIRSRLVIRTQGTLTVMLNTKVWAEMSVERASSKSVRFTALDADGQPKIFLAMGSPKDVDLLYNSLEWRVATSRAQAHDDTASDPTKKPKTEDDSKSAPVPS